MIGLCEGSSIASRVKRSACFQTIYLSSIYQRCMRRRDAKSSQHIGAKSSQHIEAGRRQQSFWSNKRHAQGAATVQARSAQRQRPPLGTGMVKSTALRKAAQIISPQNVRHTATRGYITEYDRTCWSSTSSRALRARCGRAPTPSPVSRAGRRRAQCSTP